MIRAALFIGGKMLKSKRRIGRHTFSSYVLFGMKRTDFSRVYLKCKISKSKTDNVELEYRDEKLLILFPNV